MITYRIRKIFSIFSAIYLTSNVASILVSYNNIKEQNRVDTLNKINSKIANNYQLEQNEVDILKNKINSEIANNYQLEQNNILQNDNDIEETIKQKINALNTNTNIRLEFNFTNNNNGSIKVAITIIKNGTKATITKDFTFDYEKFVAAKVRAFKIKVESLQEHIVMKNGGRVPEVDESITIVTEVIAAAKTELQKYTNNLDVKVTKESFEAGKEGEYGEIKVNLTITSKNNPIDTYQKTFKWKNLTKKQINKISWFFHSVNTKIENNIEVNNGKVPTEKQAIEAAKTALSNAKEKFEKENDLTVQVDKAEGSDSFTAGLPGQEGKIIVRLTIKRKDDEISTGTKDFKWTNLSADQNDKVTAFEVAAQTISQANIVVNNGKVPTEKQAIEAAKTALISAKEKFEKESGLTVQVAEENNSFTAGSATEKGSIRVTLTIKRETKTIKVITTTFSWINLTAAFEKAIDDLSKSNIIIINNGEVPNTAQEVLDVINKKVDNIKNELNINENSGVTVQVAEENNSFTAGSATEKGSITVTLTIKRETKTIKVIKTTFRWINLTAAFEKAIDDLSKSNIIVNEGKVPNEEQAIDDVKTALNSAKEKFEKESGLTVQVDKAEDSDSFTAGNIGAEGSIRVTLTIKRGDQTIQVITKTFKWTNLTAAFEKAIHDLSKSKTIVNEDKVPTEEQAIDDVKTPLASTKTELERVNELTKNL